VSSPALRFGVSLHDFAGLGGRTCAAQPCSGARFQRRRSSASDTTDEEWAVIEPQLPPACRRGRSLDAAMKPAIPSLGQRPLPRRRYATPSEFVECSPCGALCFASANVESGYNLSLQFEHRRR
jgi:hypothetical protein